MSRTSCLVSILGVALSVPIVAAQDVDPVKPMAAKAKEPQLSVGVYMRNVADVRMTFTDPQIRLPGGDGVLIKSVTKGSPAQAAGLEAMDIVFKINTAKIGSIADFKKWLSTAKPNVEYTFTIKRPSERDGKLTWAVKKRKLTPVIMMPMGETAVAPRIVKTNGFRGIPWGSSRGVVLGNENTEPTEADDLLGFKGQVAGLDALVAYQIIDNKLVRGSYLITAKHSIDFRYLLDYGLLALRLTEKYGEPTEDNTTWLNRLYESSGADWGTAVAAGHMTKTQRWRLADTDILLTISGDNFKIKTILRYTSTEFAHMIDALAAKKLKDGL